MPKSSQKRTLHYVIIVWNKRETISWRTCKWDAHYSTSQQHETPMFINAYRPKNSSRIMYLLGPLVDCCCWLIFNHFTFHFSHSKPLIFRFWEFIIKNLSLAFIQPKLYMIYFVIIIISLFIIGFWSCSSWVYSSCMLLYSFFFFLRCCQVWCNWI